MNNNLLDNKDKTKKCVYFDLKKTTNFKSSIIEELKLKRLKIF